jgi:hypothetical protein
MHLEEIIRKTNVSTLFILPIFQDIAKDITYKYTKVPYRLLPLLYEHGLIKTFCYSYLSQDSNSLFLLFDKEEVIKKMINTNRPGQTVNNLLISSKYFNGLDIVNDFCIFNLSIPPEYNDEIDLIKKGKYSKIGENYKDLLTVNGSILKKAYLKSELSHALVKQNIAVKVINKDPTIREDLETTLELEPKNRIPDNVEFYEKFSAFKETLTPRVLNELNK